MKHTHLALLATLLMAGCGGNDHSPATRSGDTVASAATPAPGTDSAASGAAGVADAFADGTDTLSRAELEAGRLDSSWRPFARSDTEGVGPASQGTSPGPDSSAAADAGGKPASGSAVAGGAGAATQSWDEISPRAVNAQPASFPIGGDVEGPAVARIQILLDQARFSPGIIDGRWGKNTEKAVYWFQRAQGLDATGSVDGATLDALVQHAGPAQVRKHTLTRAEVSGPFVDLPEDVYQRADMDCLCYQSLHEKLAEVFHSTPALLGQLNPGVDLDSVEAGQTLQVPAVTPFLAGDLPSGSYRGGSEVKRLVISDGGHYVHALGADGRLLYHFPSTLGSDYAPSPTGSFSVESITFDPQWHYQPKLLTGEDSTRDDAMLPGGPNNAVGVVWMQLSKPHYGVHGTNAPETIGYVTSHGCVRLTNWDAAFLARRISTGAVVQFRDVTGRGKNAAEGGRSERTSKR